MSINQSRSCACEEAINFSTACLANADASSNSKMGGGVGWLFSVVSFFLLRPGLKSHRQIYFYGKNIIDQTGSVATSTICMRQDITFYKYIIYNIL